ADESQYETTAKADESQ
ncbi:uncharacterized protein TNIN_348351, partial [Trichonephila inaurata madagascariensis]